MKKICKCTICGHEWEQGQDGSHVCHRVLKKEKEETIEHLEQLLEKIDGWLDE